MEEEGVRRRSQHSNIYAAPAALTISRRSVTCLAVELASPRAQQLLQYLVLVGEVDPQVVASGLWPVVEGFGRRAKRAFRPPLTEVVP